MKFRILVVFLALLGVVTLSAQEFRATVSGVVTDASGAAIPNAKIVATETRTGTKTETVSGATGLYTIPFLLPGDYRVTAQATGFKESVRNGLHLASGEYPVIDIRLEVGEVTQSVQVEANVSLVNTQNASTGQVITTKQVEDLPLDGRTPMMLAQLSIGVIATSNPSLVHPFDNNGAAAWSIGGTPAQTSELLMDGAPDEMWSGSLAYSPPQDAVQEVTVDAFNTDAAYGHSFGGTANQILKTGTNGFHGSMYEFTQASALDANDFFSNRAGKP
ncbi:MAG: carboxypeptidase-like regulatory domain-containing protein, partial [Candidatus Acidiferrales bacterium]